MTLSSLRERLDLNLVLVVLASVFSFAPLTYPGYFQSHSGFLPVFNLYDLESGLWRNWGWLPHVATGPLQLSGEGALPYLLAAALRWLALSGPQAIKAIYLLGLVTSGLAMYVLGKRLFGATAGLLAALVYIYLPFHLATVYVRGAFAEAWAFALYPLLLLCWQRYLSNFSILWAALAVVAYCALATTVLGLALLLAIPILAVVLVFSPSPRTKRSGFLILVLSVCLGLLFQIPSLLRYGMPTLSEGDFAQHFVYPFQLLSAAWGYGASVPGWQDSMPFQLGLAATGLALMTGVLLSRGRGARGRLASLVCFLGGGALAAVFLMLPASAFFWRASHLSLLLRYPWQLLAFAGLAISLLAGAAVSLAPQLGRLPWQAVLVTLVVLSSYSYLSPQFTDLQVGGAPVAVFGDRVLLLSYQLEGPLVHGATVHLTLNWQSIAQLSEDYTVFAHIVDNDGAIWAQCDSAPGGSERSTSSWIPGEIFQDDCEMTIDVGGPREGYIVQVGLYESTTGTRLTLPDGRTAVILEWGVDAG
jgi:hypothetical protein